MDINTNLPPSARGWGPPCVTTQFTAFAFNGKQGSVAFPAGINTHLLDLASHLLAETEDRGYLLHPGWCWGQFCREISGTNVYSNHAWGMALDINAPANPLGGTTTDMPSWMPDLWNEYGWRWGGDYSGRKDPMHYEFQGTPTDAVHMTELARERLVTLTPEQIQELDWVKGFQKYMRGEKEPVKQGAVKRGWNDAQITVVGRPPQH